MNEYSLTTKKNWLETKIELESELKAWKITDWVLSSSTQRYVSLQYILRGREITLTMDKQMRPQDNLRVIYLCIRSLRLNEVRGMSDIIESAYLQLNAPIIDKDPYDVLGLPRGTAKTVCEAQYRELVKQYHPDKGGDPQKMAQLTKAIEEIRKR